MGYLAYDDVFDVSRIQAGKFTLSFQNVDLSHLVRDVTTRFSGQLTATGSTLSLEIQEGVLGWFDALRMEEVVDNLLANAIKYAAGTPVRVTLAVRSGKAVLEIADGGPGISRERQAKIFERFGRADTEGKVSALGLGLTL